MEKNCYRCGELQELKEYHKKTAYKDGLDVYCKSCRKIKGKIYPPDVIDPNLNWKGIKGFEKTHILSSSGLIYNLIRERYIKSTINTRGYYAFSITLNKERKGKELHRLLAETFIPNPDNKNSVNHINGIKTDNSLENLEWCTHKENMHHARATGLMHPPKGQDHIWAKKVIVRKELLVLEFPTISATAKYLDSTVTSVSSRRLKMKGKPLKGWDIEITG